MEIKQAKPMTINNDVPSRGSFSYFVSFDVLKTPLIFKAAKVYEKHQSGKEEREIKTRNEDKKLHTTVPDRSDNGKKWARNMRILPQKTTSFAYDIQTNTLSYGLMVIMRIVQT